MTDNNDISNIIQLLNDICKDNTELILNIYNLSDDNFKLVENMLNETKRNNSTVIESTKNNLVRVDVNLEMTKLFTKLKNCNNFLKAITSEYSFYDTFTECQCKFCHELKEIHIKDLHICKRCFETFHQLSVKNKIIKYFDNFTI